MIGLEARAANIQINNVALNASRLGKSANANSEFQIFAGKTFSCRERKREKRRWWRAFSLS
jgi:hypothetical protein